MMEIFETYSSIQEFMDAFEGSGFCQEEVLEQYGESEAEDN